MVINSELVILREFLSPLDLTAAQALCIYKSTQVVMAGEDKNFMLAVFQIVVPYLECFNNSQELTIISFIPSLCKNYLSGEKSYWVPLANFRSWKNWIFGSHVDGRPLVESQLHEDSTNGIARCISFNPDIIFRIKMMKDWCLGKAVL